MPLSLWLWWFSVRWFLKQADFGLLLFLNGCRAVLKKTLVNATIIMIMVIQRSVISEASRSWIASSPKWLPSCAKKVATVTLQDHTFRVSSFSRFSNSTTCSNNMNAFRSAVGHRVGFFFIFVQYSSRPRVPYKYVIPPITKSGYMPNASRFRILFAFFAIFSGQAAKPQWW